MTSITKETDLFAPVRDFFLGQGYEVAAEVKHCDVVASKADELIVIELKTSLNMTLITQGVKRQRLTNTVYIAIPEPKRKSRRFRDQVAVVKRLGLGLLTIYHSPVRSVAKEHLKPQHAGSINKRKRAALNKEIAGRSIQPNKGGSNEKIYTAYRETAVTIAYLLGELGPSRAADIAPITGEKTRSVLYANHYGWFERVSHGVYRVNEDGLSALLEYPELIELASQLETQKPLQKSSPKK